MWFTELKIKIHFLYQLQFKTFCNYSQIQINREDRVSLAKINLRTTKILCTVLNKKLVILPLAWIYTNIYLFLTVKQNK